MEDLETHAIDSSAGAGGSELFDVIAGLTAGEAITIVRGTEKMSGSFAWEKLCERLNSNTPANALALTMEVMNPEHETDPNRIPQAVGEWDWNMQCFEKVFGAELFDRMKTALVLSMTPGDLRDMMYQQAANLKDYSDAKARLKGLLQNRIFRNQPTPVEIGKVGNDKREHDKQIYYVGKREGKGKGACHQSGQQSRSPENALKTMAR